MVARGAWIRLLLVVISSKSSGSSVVGTTPVVAFATHCSIDRLWNLERACVRWNGLISVAIHTPAHSEPAAVVALATNAVRSCSHANIALYTSPAETYPINILRNMALRGAKALNASHVFVIDADFWPSKNTRHLIEAALLEVEGSSSLNAIVVPAFEMRSSHLRTAHVTSKLMPATVHELMSCLARCRRAFPALTSAGKKEVYCTPFHHHGSTRFAQWLVSLKPQRLGCFTGNYFEPFVVVPLRHARLFDTSYEGYGKNKLDYIVSLRGRNFTFWTAPRAFVVHTQHAASRAHREWLDSNSSHKYAMDALFNRTLKRQGLNFDGDNGVHSGARESSLATKYCSSPDVNMERYWTSMGLDQAEVEDRLRDNNNNDLAYFEDRAVTCDVVSRVSSACIDTPQGRLPAKTTNCSLRVEGESTRWNDIDRATDTFWRRRRQQGHSSSGLRQNKQLGY